MYALEAISAIIFHIWRFVYSPPLQRLRKGFESEILFLISKADPVWFSRGKCDFWHNFVLYATFKVQEQRL